MCFIIYIVFTVGDKTTLFMLKPVLNMLFEYYDRHNTFFVKIVEGREKSRTPVDEKQATRNARFIYI